jgi:hypothetical protein
MNSGSGRASVTAAQSIRRFAALLGVGALVALGTGCETPVCEESSGATFGLTVRAMDDEWAYGKYLVEVTADDVTSTFNYTHSANNIAAVDYQEPIYFSFAPSCPPGSTLSDCDTPWKYELHVNIESTPANVNVSISRDGMPLGQQSFSPTCTTSQTAEDCEVEDGACCVMECLPALSTWILP